MATASKKGSRGKSPPSGQILIQLSVAGFKSIVEPQTIGIRPLTILAGANSSGKSSMMQPLLLMKQTLDAPYDAGPLLLNGPNVRFTNSEQLFSKTQNRASTEFSVDLQATGDTGFGVSFRKGGRDPLEITETRHRVSGGGYQLRPEMTHKELAAASRREPLCKLLPLLGPYSALSIVRHGFFLSLTARVNAEVRRFVNPESQGLRGVRDCIHIPGIRGNPERSYPLTATGSTFAGTFDRYAASMVAHWQFEKDAKTLAALAEDLCELELTWKVVARRLSDTDIELSVGRLPKAAKGGSRDLVNIADVGFGVSQVLPVIVALHAAKPGQLVYVEQPELHLHPRAQRQMAQVLVRAAQRGLRLVIETHSQLLLLAIQTLVAQGKCPTDLVYLHWFERMPDGQTRIITAELDENGAFGDWPEDFAEVALEAESKYLDAVERRHGGK